MTDNDLILKIERAFTKIDYDVDEIQQDISKIINVIDDLDKRVKVLEDENEQKNVIIKKLSDRISYLERNQESLEMKQENVTIYPDDDRWF